MSKLTDSARDQLCSIRIPSVCCSDLSTTVPCHYRLAGLSGERLKSPDLFFADGCVNCHDAVDRRRFRNLEYDFVRLAHAEGVFRTQYRMLRQGLVAEPILLLAEIELLKAENRKLQYAAQLNHDTIVEMQKHG